jgi:hypothetical protein
MLTADLVDARRKDGALVLRPLDAEAREEARLVARALLDAARDLVGHSREEVEEAWDLASDALEPKRVKVAAGLRKLAADACSFEAETSVDPVEVRRVLFTRASEVRRSGDGRLDREAVVAEAAQQLGVSASVVERAMFSDLRGEHLLTAAPAVRPEQLVESWELGQAQAVLLTAVRVTCEVSSGSPGLVRAFFSRLKFHKLLFTAEPLARKDGGPGGWRVVIDGPFSMFESVTKYGVRMAFVLPALRALERWSLVAEIRWGKAREPLAFRLSSTDPEAPPPGPADADELHLSDEVRELAQAIDALESGWTARPATVLLDVPGGGVCIPDLVLSRKGSREPVYVEVLGYWSRDAVFRRIELCERGLRAHVVFCASSRLRVSEELLDADASSRLYVYKGKMSPRAILDRATALVRPR